MHDRRINRKRLKAQSGGLRLIRKNALVKITSKQQKEKKAKRKQIENNFMKMWRMKQNKMLKKNVIVKKAKKARIKQVKELMKDYAFIFSELKILIFDFEIE